MGPWTVFVYKFQWWGRSISTSPQHEVHRISGPSWHRILSTNLSAERPQLKEQRNQKLHLRHRGAFGVALTWSSQQAPDSEPETSSSPPKIVPATPMGMFDVASPVDCAVLFRRGPVDLAWFKRLRRVIGGSGGWIFGVKKWPQKGQDAFFLTLQFASLWIVMKWRWDWDVKLIGAFHHSLSRSNTG